MAFEWMFEDQQQAKQAQPVKKGGRGGTLTSLISEGGALGGAAVGAAAGSVVPVVGTALGGIIGAGLGAFGGRLAENKIRDDRWGVGDAAGEGALSAVLTGPLRALKYAGGAVKGSSGGGLAEALRAGAVKADAPGAVSRALKKGSARASQRAANKFVEITPSSMRRLQDEGVDPHALLSKWGEQLGKNYDEMIRNSNNLIKSAEDAISSTAGVAGRNIRIDGSDIVKKLEVEAKKIRSELGGGSRYKQIQTIIDDAKRKYSKGITVKQARDILREANQRFGASVLDDTGDAVARAAQKLEANTLRDALKSRFPTIEKALDDQAELIQLRELLKQGKAANAAKKGTNLGKLDITRPGTVLDIMLAQPGATRKWATRSNADANAKPGIARSAITGSARAGRGATVASLAEASVSPPQSDISSTNPMSNPATTNTTIAPMTNPMPELSHPNVNMSTSPFSPENLENSVQTILANGGTLEDVTQFVGLAKTLQELSPTSKATPGLNVTKPSAANLVQAQSGIQSLMELEDIMSNDPGVLQRTATPGRGVNALGIGSAIRNITNTGEFDQAGFNAVENLLRIKTGAAAPEQEVRRYMSQYLPQPGDSPSVVRQKMNSLYSQFQSIIDLAGGQTTPTGLEDALLMGAY